MRSSGSSASGPLYRHLYTFGEYRIPENRSTMRTTIGSSDDGREKKRMMRRWWDVMASDQLRMAGFIWLLPMMGGKHDEWPPLQATEEQAYQILSSLDRVRPENAPKRTQLYSREFSKFTRLRSRTICAVARFVLFMCSNTSNLRSSAANSMVTLSAFYFLHYDVGWPHSSRNDRNAHWSRGCSRVSHLVRSIFRVGGGTIAMGFSVCLQITWDQRSPTPTKATSTVATVMWKRLRVDATQNGDEFTSDFCMKICVRVLTRLRRVYNIRTHTITRGHNITPHNTRAAMCGDLCGKAQPGQKTAPPKYRTNERARYMNYTSVRSAPDGRIRAMRLVVLCWTEHVLSIVRTTKNSAKDRDREDAYGTLSWALWQMCRSRRTQFMARICIHLHTQTVLCTCLPI